MLFLYRLIIGFLEVIIKGENLENILNAAAREHISFWDLHYKKRAIVGNITVSDFKRLKSVRRKKGARIHILKKRGLPFLLKRYKNRIGFFIGVSIFFITLYTLSLFIWDIKIEGNKTEKADEIISVCEELGIKIGTFKKKINPKVDAQRLMLKNKGIAWASLNIEGAVLTVNLSETREKEKDKREPGNLVATADGIIKKIDLTSGNAVVKVGDAVKKGDLLVSGVIERLSGTEFVLSEGTVTAETIKTFFVEAFFDEERKTPNGEIKKRTVLTFFGLDIPLYVGSIKGEYISEKNAKQVKLLNGGLPIFITTKKFTILSPQKFHYNKTQINALLEERLQKRIQQEKIKEYIEIEREYIEQNGGKGLKVTIKTTENIAKRDMILLESKN